MPGIVRQHRLFHHAGSIPPTADNLLNKKYYNGWSTVSPQRLFNVSIGAEYRF